MTSEEMEPDPDPLLLPLQGARILPSTSTKTSARQPPRQPQQYSPQGKDVARSPVFLRTAPRDATKARRPLPTARKGNDRSTAPTTAWKPSTPNISSPKTKPLLPLMERKSQEDKATVRRQRNNSDVERYDITPDGGSSGREGRQFTVGNVGNNGRIYLRPTVRPSYQRYPQPHFVFPMTPPQTAGLGAPTNDKARREDTPNIGQIHGSGWTPSQDPSTPTTQPLQSLLLDDRQTGMAGHRRALSDSTISGSVAARESDPGAFKIVVTQPGEEQRPKTVEDIDTKKPPHLEISIPSWKMGTPRFSIRGTPFIRGSSYAPTEEIRSSIHSPLDRSGGLTPRFRSSIGSRRPGSFMVPQGRYRDSQQSQLMSPVGFSPSHVPRQTYMSPYIDVTPSMFDALTFKPACDDRAVVRYSSSTGAVTAATPPRLVAEITSPSFLDYELLSDFFLTFRAYLEPMHLLKMLFARMRWALARDDDVGMVVRVRTFVALRHWILNYFVEDFVCEYDMRLNFCNLLNSLIDDISQDSKCRRVQHKILAELKKCWRRVCAQFWDGPEFEASLPPEAPIAPGGIPGHRNPSLDPEFWQKYLDNGPPQLDDVLTPLPNNLPDVETSFFRDVARAGGDEVLAAGGSRPGTPENQVTGRDTAKENQVSPTSISSADVVSCSLPTRTLKSSSPASNNPLGAHPVDPGPVYNNLEPVAATPRALAGKRVRAQYSHKHSGSQSDSLREQSISLEQLLQKNTETLLSLPYAGSLVRGNVLPPGQAFVEVLSPTSGYGGSRQTTVFQPYPDDSQVDTGTASAMSGQGMRKLIGSVRRALSTRGQDVSPTQENFNIGPIGPRGVTTNRLPGTAIVPQARLKTDSSRPPVRIDLLGAGIVEDFKRVIREDAAAEAALRCYHGSMPSTPSTIREPGDNVEYSAAHLDSLLRVSRDDTRPISEGALSTGSKSIVIIDDTLHVPNDFSSMTGAFPAFNPSVEAFAESFMPQGADPTPPSTPPGRTTDTPRRSSHLLGQHMPYSARSIDALPPFVPDLNSLAGGSNTRPSEDTARPSLNRQRPSSDIYRRSVGRPPVSMARGHGRHRSSRSLRSMGTMGPKQYASFHSGMAPRSMVRSFDATTYSDRASLDQSSEIPIPQPLRLLRRRPGGDLRAFDHVEDLDHKLLRRSRSVGSLTTYTESLRTSFFNGPGMARDSMGLVDVVNSDYSRARAEVFSLGVIAEKPKRKLSLLSTNSSKPIMRPSFEAEAQKLANLPDDDDDGGVESALLKLEGKYQKRSLRLSREPSRTLLKDLEGTNPNPPDPQHDIDMKMEKKKHRQEHIVEEGVMPPAPPAEESPDLSQSSFLHVPEKGRSLRDEVVSFLSDESNDSYSSIPLLQRGMTDEGRTSQAEWTNRSVLQGPDDDVTSADARNDEDEHCSFEVVKKSESLEDIKPGDTMPTARERSNTGDSHQSFLNIDSDDDDELSSELSDNPLDDDDDDDLVAFPSSRRGATLTQVQPAASQLNPTAAQANHLGSEPSPPITIAQALAMNPETANVPELHSAQIWGPDKPLPPAPGYAPTFGQSAPTSHSRPSPDPTGVNEGLRNAAAHEEEAQRKYAAHLPFILAFDSEVLAQQFTLIEKDALDEIDWKELIEMQWKNADNNDCRSWVHFLRDADARGVEVVIARFNIVVKWAISEIVLTQDIEERARCIIKYIHIAAHCRRYRNFATMSQIAVALTSVEVGRLTRTWKMVPARDMRTLHELEVLIYPTRNFYALRAEMEGGGSLTAADMGCIPFVGIYTHDLIFNAQRPSEIASSPTTAPLINFERCRIAACVVKTLLRLLEASTRYNFQPIEGITERCLWMSALSDGEIRRHSEHLQ